MRGCPSSAPQGGCSDPGSEAGRSPPPFPLPPPALHCQGCSAQKLMRGDSASSPIPWPGDYPSSEACQSRGGRWPSSWAAETGWGVWGTGPHAGSHRHTHTGLGWVVTEVLSPNLICSLGATLNATQVLGHLILTTTFSKGINITPDFTNEETEAHRLARRGRTRI